MRLLSIVFLGLLCSSVPAAAQRVQSDNPAVFALPKAASDSINASATAVHYPVMRHTMYGTLGGAAIAGSLFGVLSVLCSSPSCPRMGPAITFGIAFGALTGAAVGAVSGLNSPEAVTSVASKSAPRSASR